MGKKSLLFLICKPSLTLSLSHVYSHPLLHACMRIHTQPHTHTEEDNFILVSLFFCKITSSICCFERMNETYTGPACIKIFHASSQKSKKKQNCMSSWGKCILSTTTPFPQLHNRHWCYDTSLKRISLICF